MYAICQKYSIDLEELSEKGDELVYNALVCTDYTCHIDRAFIIYVKKYIANNPKHMILYYFIENLRMNLENFGKYLENPPNQDKIHKIWFYAISTAIMTIINSSLMEKIYNYYAELAKLLVDCPYCCDFVFDD